MSDHALTPARGRRPTMIKGLIPTLPERGKIKIGMKGPMVTSRRGTEFQPPQKLDHFVVTTLQRGEDGNFIPDETLMKRLGDKPTEIPVRLLYDDPTLNFPTRYACFAGRSLWCSGDGEVAIRATPSGPQEVACTCERADPAYKGNDKCKMNGSLSVLIEGAGGIGGVWKFRTTSYNSIVGIMSTMAFIRSMTGGVLANIPLKLRVQPKQTTAPDGNPVTIYFVSLEFDGDMPGLQEIAHGIALGRAKMNISIEHIEEEAKRLLALAPPSNVPLAGDDADDVIEEFYPEQAITEPEPPRGRDIAPEMPQTKPAEIVDAETGEVFDAATIEREARSAAARGTDAFREHLRGLSRAARANLNGKVGTKDAPGELLILAMRTDEALRDAPPDEPTDAFGLPPTGTPQPHSPAGGGNHADQPTAQKGSHALAGAQNSPAGDAAIKDMFGGAARPPAGFYRVALPDDPKMADFDRWLYNLKGKIKDSPDAKEAIRRDNKDNISIFRDVDEVRHEALIAMLGGGNG